MGEMNNCDLAYSGYDCDGRRRATSVRRMVYNQGHPTGGPFRLRRFPRAAAALRRELRAPRYGAVAPEHAVAAGGRTRARRRR
jgi:hypothetical protein